MAIWVCADLHLQHENIIKYGRSQFKTIKEHDEYVIDRYNSVVGKDDLVYILGDVCFRPANTAISLMKRLNGRKILVLGNHDRMTEEDYRKAGFIQVVNHPIFYSNNIILSHIPVLECLNSPYTINVHGHIHKSSLALLNFFNANVDVNDFLPVSMSVFEEKAARLCTPHRWQPFGSEWYKTYYTKEDVSG